MSLPHPVIFLPGITMTNLQDDYPLPPDDVWTALRNEFERIAMHPDDLRYEAVEPARMQHGQIFELTYRELVEELKHNLTGSLPGPVPVFPFGYDWRMPLEMAQEKLASFIDEVISRTKLMRHYHEDKFGDNPKVNLIGHSMGGLIIAGYLHKYGVQGKVSKVATIGTPFQGSYEAIVKIATGTANLGSTPPSSREREASRLIPALYYLIPSFNGCVNTPPDANLDDSLFNPAIYQPSIIDSITAFVKKHGIFTQDPSTQAKKLFTDLLARAGIHRLTTDTVKLSNYGLTDQDWLCVVGVDCVTRTSLRVAVDGNQKPYFNFTSKDRQNQWGDKNQVERRHTGDGTVPLEGALPKFIPEERIVCVSPGDFGYWEIQDRLLTNVAGFHGIFPNMDMLHRLIVRFFTNKNDTYGNTWGRRLPGVQTWNPPLALKEK